MNDTYTKVIDYLNQNVFEEDDYDTITNLIDEFDKNLDRLEEFKTLCKNDDIKVYIQNLIDDYPEKYFTCDHCTLVYDMYNECRTSCRDCELVYCEDCATELIHELFIPCPHSDCYYCRRGHCFNPRIEQICDNCIDEETLEQIEQHERDINETMDRILWLEQTEETRRKELITELAKYKLKLRSDSKLCKNYIRSADNSITYVVRRMCEMKYLFDYCDMRKELESVEKEHIQTLEWGYIPDAGVFQEAEANIIERIGSYPGVWPWM